MIVTRFAPSPTGYLHIGGARTALFNYLFATHEGGRMYLRFEDTDRERSKKEYEEDIIEGLRWLGISYALPEIARQSERTDVYRKYFKTLLDKGLAYEAEPSTAHPAKRVVRFKNPNTEISFQDHIRGQVSFDTTELADFIIAKSVDEPLFHLAVVIDDHEMGVTHVIRGEDHISNTPRQILILEALGFSRPEYAHMPLILAPDRSKLSKRHGAVSVNEYRRSGYLPQALLNYLALLGWNPGGERELYDLEGLTASFSLDHVQKSGAVFDIEKLKWFNREYLKKLTAKEFESLFAEYIQTVKTSAVPPYLPKAVQIIQERAETFEQAFELLHTDCSFLEDSTNYGAPFPTPLLTKGAKADASTVLLHLTALMEILKDIKEKDFTAANVKEIVFPYAEKAGRSTVLWPLRVALSGKEKSPDPFIMAEYLGKDMTVQRIDSALQRLRGKRV